VVGEAVEERGGEFLVSSEDLDPFSEGEDMVLVLEGHVGYPKMLDAKIKAAQTRGLVYVHPPYREEQGGGRGERIAEAACF